MGRISLPEFSFHSRDAVWDKEIKVVSEHTRFVLQTSASISLTLLISFPWRNAHAASCISV